MSEDLRVYKEKLLRLQAANSDEIFSNGRLEHAAAIFETFFNGARDRVVIFCQNLNAEVFDKPEVRRSLARCLQQNVRVEILCQEEPQSMWILDLADQTKTAAGDSLNVPEVLVCGPDDPKTKALPENFAVIDSTAIRVEPNKGEPKAWASMNQPRLAASLEQAFDRLKGAFVGA